MTGDGLLSVLLKCPIENFRLLVCNVSTAIIRGFFLDSRTYSFTSQFTVLRSLFFLGGRLIRDAGFQRKVDLDQEKQRKKQKHKHEKDIKSAEKVTLSKSFPCLEFCKSIH